MDFKFAAAAVFGAASLMAAPALAWSERASTQPTAEAISVWAYPSKQNFCPAGLQPVTIGGVICCGQPTHTGYKSHPASRRARYDTGYVAYGKGYNEGSSGN